MKVLNDVGLLFFGMRGLMYLDAFVRAGTLPGIVIIQNDNITGIYKKQPDRFWRRYKKYFDIDKTPGHYLSKFQIEHTFLKNGSVNSHEFKAAISERPETFFIFSGGGILKKDIFGTGKRFIHIHPGILPEYKGSTCYYYSILKEGKCGASAFFMNEKLDAGDIIDKKVFDVPSVNKNDWIFFDMIFDPWIRARLLLKILNRYKKEQAFDSYPQDMKKGEMYSVIHPVLKNISISRKII